MKSVLILCFVVVLTLASPVQHRWDRVHAQCQSNPALYVDDRIFEELKRGQNPALPANFGQHANCMLVKLDLVDGHGHVLSSGVRQAGQRSISDPSKLNQIVNECSANDSTKEKTALKLFSCLGKHHIDIGQF